MKYIASASFILLSFILLNFTLQANLKGIKEMSDKLSVDDSKNLQELGEGLYSPDLIKDKGEFKIHLRNCYLGINKNSLVIDDRVSKVKDILASTTEIVNSDINIYETRNGEAKIEILDKLKTKEISNSALLDKMKLTDKQRREWLKRKK